MTVPDRPTIGITASVENVRYGGAWREDAVMVPRGYADAVTRAGARPLVLPPDVEDADDPASVLALVDGLIVSGRAGDVGPAHYGQAPHPETHPVDPLRDRYEMALVTAARARGLPVLGVCRGMQVINVAFAERSSSTCEDPRGPFLLGVLWHPEEQEESRLIAALVEQARGSRDARGA